MNYYSSTSKIIKDKKTGETIIVYKKERKEIIDKLETAE
jgi:hypothetical protein